MRSKYETEIKEMMQNFEYRQEVFKKVFNGNDGELVLEYLATVNNPRADFSNERKLYYDVGKRDAISDIIAILTKEKKRVKND